MTNTAAIIFLVVEVLVLWLLHRVVRAFGAYTEAFLKAHTSNQITQQQFAKAVDFLEQLLRKENAA